MNVCTRIALFTVALVAGFASAASASPPIGAPAPPFTLTTIDGKIVTLETFRGKTLVLNVWGSWCPPCRLETPDLALEANAMRAKGVAFVGIDTTETAAVVRAYAAAKGVPYPQVATTGRSAFARDYGITNYPTTFVIDPNGVLRAIHADNILPRPQLDAYIVAAQHGQTAPLVSAEQQKLDTMLAPVGFAFDGDPSAVLRNVRAADKAISDADDEMDAAMIDPARDHDLLATKAEQEALRVKAIAALQTHAAPHADDLLLARMQGDELVAEGRFADAIPFYESALVLNANDPAALSGLAYARSTAGDEAGALDIRRRIAAAYPTYANEIGLARAYAATGDHAGTIEAIDIALPLAAKVSPGALAWSHLYAGRAALEVNDRGRARVEFSAAEVAAEHVPRENPRYTWYLEQSQEALLALGLGASRTTMGLSIAPWTGPELPGSIASTYKFRVALSGAAGTSVTLRASGLPKTWIASFCSDRMCSPFTLVATIPASGIKIVEFQVIPGAAHASAHPTVRVSAQANGTEQSASAVVE
jgi:peroxiredoxin/tetratricopeptide (TPR) repeat protein